MLTQTYPNGDLVTKGYTPEGWLSSVSLSQGATTTTLSGNADYQGLGGATQHVTSAQLGNGVYASSTTYDLLVRPTDVKLSRSVDSSVLFEQQRSFSAAGNVSTASTSIGGATDNQAFCYDDLDRLTWAGSTGTPACGTALTPGHPDGGCLHSQLRLRQSGPPEQPARWAPTATGTRPTCTGPRRSGPPTQPPMTPPAT